MGRLSRIVLLVIAVLAAGWIAMLAVLPDAPRTAGTRASPAVRPAAGGCPVQSTSGSRLIVPVAGVARGALADSWGDPRENGLRLHHGTDIAAPSGSQVLAAAPGTVEKLFTSAAGGTAVYVRSPDRRWTYYYAHLAGYAPGLHEGQGVTAGTLLGYVGDTGNAGAGNFHLHFGLTRTTPEQHWYEGEDVDPYRYLAGQPLPS